MNCKKCGFSLEPNEKFCPNCGEKVEETLPNLESVEKKEEEVVKTPIIPEAKEAPLPGTSNKETENLNNEVNHVETPVDPSVDPVIPESHGIVENSLDNQVEKNVNQTDQALQTPVNSVDQTLETPVSPSAKKKSSPLITIIIIILAITAAVLLFLLLFGTKSLKNNSNKTTSSTTSSTTTTTTKPIANTQVIGGVSVAIPNGWNYANSDSEGVGIITNQSNGMQINIFPISTLNFEYCKTNSSALENALTGQGAQVLNRTTSTHGSQYYLYYEIIFNNKNEIVLFTNMPDGNTIRFEIMNSNVDLNAAMEITNSIASSATSNIN